MSVETHLLTTRGGKSYIATVEVDSEVLARALFARAWRNGKATALFGGVVVTVKEGN